MPDVRKSLLQLVFSGASMKRWNDKLRPMELVELDKQAHKMIAAWVLFELNSEGLSEQERLRLGTAIVEGGMFDYLYRLVITDIKPPVFYQIKANPDHYQRLTSWVLEQLAPRVQPLGVDFWDRLENYLTGGDPNDLARRILNAAHLYASSWEFNLIKGINKNDEEFSEIEKSFVEGLENHFDLLGVQELTKINSPLGRFTRVCGQLRFQKRWSQTPRIPETSVLGHMFLVACYGYFFSLALGACPARAQNNFFSGLVHDLPELLTRDIISPVKKSVEQLSELISQYEDAEMQRRVFGPLCDGGYTKLANRLGYFLGMEVESEFTPCIIRDGKVEAVSFEELQGEYNHDRFDPKDGNMLKVCDSLAAFIEAYNAVRNGISSDQLQQALWRIRTAYGNVSLADNVHIGALLADFD